MSQSQLPSRASRSASASRAWLRSSSCSIRLRSVMSVTRRIEQELERGHARLAEAERLARLVTGTGTDPGSKMTCSDGLLEIYGISAEEFDDTYEVGHSNYVHPDDRASSSRIRQALDTER